MRVAAVDQGTTSTRCLVVEDGGTWSIAGALRHRQHLPAPGWVEHDPAELLQNIEDVLASAGPVDAIAISTRAKAALHGMPRPESRFPRLSSGRILGPQKCFPGAARRRNSAPGRSAGFRSTLTFPPANSRG